MNDLNRKSESPTRHPQLTTGGARSWLTAQPGGGSGYNGRMVEPEIWKLLELSDSEIPAALHALNIRFRELPGFPGLSLGCLPDYRIHEFQRPGVGL